MKSQRGKSVGSQAGRVASADSGWHETDRFNAHTWEGGVEMVATSFLLLCVVRWEKRKAEAGRVGGADGRTW